jgi:PAS domain S-box-containing protein
MSTPGTNQGSESGSAPGRSQAVVVADRDGVIRYWNEAASVLTGHDGNSVIGRSLDVIVPPEYRERHWSRFRAAMESGVSRFEGMSANLPVLHADGSVRRWPSRFSVLRDARGRPAGAAAVLVEPAEDDPWLFDV